MGGVPSYWRTLGRDSQTNAAWAAVYRSFDVISPWSVGRYSENSEMDRYSQYVIARDLAEAKVNGCDYLPVIWPGFSWHNLKGDPLNQVPRRGGEFYWRQAYLAVTNGCGMIYGAMFDEMDEGTAMFKLAPTSAQLPAQGKFVPLNADGTNLPSDWYLRLANQAGKMLRGEIPAKGKAADFTVKSETHFKGWAKPGPVPPGVGVQASACSGDTLKRELQHGAPPKIEAHETLDAISGHFRLFQLGDGHRFSTDDILAAWYGTSWCPTARMALDLGSGIGTVGMICAWRLPGVKLVTIEAQAESVALARKSARYNGIEDRCEIREGDFRSAEVLRADEKFDLITGSPPYFPPEAGVKSEHPQKLACRFELRGTIADYCSAAARHLAPGGFFACVFPHEPAQLARVEASARKSGLVIVRKRPVVFREGDPALVALFGMMRAGTAGMVSRPDLDRAGFDHPHARRKNSSGIFGGKACHWFSAVEN